MSIFPRTAAVFFLLFCCGCSRGGSTSSPPDNLPPVHADAEGNVPLPEGFPSDVPRYPGRTAAAAAIHPTVQVTLETDDDRSKVQAWYVAKLPEQGWKIELEKDDAGTHVIHTRKNDQPLTVELSEDAGKTRILLKYTPKGQE